MLRFSQLPLSLRTAGCQTSSRLWATDSRCSAAQGTPTWKHFSVDLWTFLKVWFPHHPFLCLAYKWRFSLGSVSYEVLNPTFHRATENYRAWSGNLQGKIVAALKWWHKKCFSSRSAKIWVKRATAYIHQRVSIHHTLLIFQVVNVIISEGHSVPQQVTIVSIGCFLVPKFVYNILECIYFSTTVARVYQNMFVLILLSRSNYRHDHATAIFFLFTRFTFFIFSWLSLCGNFRDHTSNSRIVNVFLIEISVCSLIGLVWFTLTF